MKRNDRPLGWKFQQDDACRSFLDNLLINYGYNHQNGTHRELFGIKANCIPVFEQSGYWAKVVQELDRTDATFAAPECHNSLPNEEIMFHAQKLYQER